MRRRRSPARVGSHASATTWSSTASTRFMSRASSRAVRSRASRARSHSSRSAISSCCCYRRGMVKLVAAGEELRIPAGEYHVATPVDVAYADLAALCAEAMVHGGCVGQLDPMFEGDEPTYVVVLRVDAAALVLERGGTTLALAGAASESAPFIAFASDSTFNGPTLGPTSFVLGYRDDCGDLVWEGDGWTIRRPVRASCRRSRGPALL